MRNLNASTSAHAPGTVRQSEPRRTGIDVVGDAPWGTHFCQFYENSRDLADILVPYFKAGLEGDEFCMWITSPDFSTLDAQAALRRAMPDFDRYLQEGRIEILPHSEWYLLGGTFDLKRVMDGWIAKLGQALARGLQGLRLSGNTVWLEKADWKGFTEYEEAINSVIGQYPMMALCSYSLARCGAAEILDVVRNHQFALLRSEMGWQLLESCELRQARERQRETEVRYRSLFNALNEGFALHEILCDVNGQPFDYRFIEVNPAFERLTGLTRDAVIGRTVRQVIPDVELFWIQTYGRVALTRQPAHFEFSSEALGRLYEVFAYSPAPRQFAALFLDATERKQANEERERLLIEADVNLNQLEAVVNSISQGLIIADTDGTILSMNPAALALHGFRSIEELKARLATNLDLFEMSSPEGEQIRLRDRPMALALQGQRVVNMHMRVRRRDTGKTWIGSYSATPVKNKAGETVLSVVTIHDLTELKESEEALRRAKEELELRVASRTTELVATNEALLREIAERKKSQEEVQAASQYARSLIEASLDPLVTISHEGRITDVNKATELVTGLPRHELIGSDFSSYFTEPEKAEEGYRKVISEGRVTDYPLTICSISGQTTDVLYNAAVYRNQVGEVQGVFAAARDITDRKAMERVLHNSEARYRSLVTASAQMIWTTSPRGEVVGDIPSWQAFTGQTREQVQGSGWIEALHPDDRARTIEIWSRSVVSQTTYSTEYRVRRHDGVYRHFAVRAVPVFDPPGTAREWIGACTDVTEAKDAESELSRYRGHLEELVAQRTVELQRANERLQQEIEERLRAEQTLRQTADELVRSNRDLEQFASATSHDLQEPLRAVAGYVDLLEQRYRDKLDEKAMRYIAAAADGAARMQTLITDLLAYSRVGTRAQGFQPADLSEVLESALSNLAVSISESGARIVTSPLPTLRVDATQIAQLFQNLIGNAVKFRSERVPEIRIGAERQDDRWVFSVRDNGIGIDPQYSERVFMLFQRLHTRQRYPGTGIGLAICKRIVERHEGRIWVDTKPGEGSTFYFTIPRDASLPAAG